VVAVSFSCEKGTSFNSDAATAQEIVGDLGNLLVLIEDILSPLYN
jgi:hypothetical protein